MFEVLFPAPLVFEMVNLGQGKCSCDGYNNLWYRYNADENMHLKDLATVQSECLANSTCAGFASMLSSDFQDFSKAYFYYTSPDICSNSKKDDCSASNKCGAAKIPITNTVWHTSLTCWVKRPLPQPVITLDSLPPEATAEFNKIFNAIDTNKNGEVNSLEI